MIIDDIRRLNYQTLKRKKGNCPAQHVNTDRLKRHTCLISRSEFLMKAGIMATSVPVAYALGSAWRITRMGLFDYHVKC
jgi:hypothetical protein